MGTPRPRALILDAGALIALERGNERVRSLLRLAAHRDITLVIPDGVLAQVWRDGGRQALLNRLLRDPRVENEPLDTEVARACGSLCGRAGTSDVVDASVVVAARKWEAVILILDPTDLRRLGPGLRLERI